MRSIAGLIFCMVCLCCQLEAQRIRYATLKGNVIDSLTRQPIEAATVSVFLLADSTLIAYDITNKKGEFLLKEVPQDQRCRVMVSFSGLNSWSQEFIITPPAKELVLKTIQLRKAYTELEEVIVSARRPPVLIKKDTIEFDAASFRALPNSVVEELLKQLPGLEVDAAGNITVNGKRVSKIMINGKDIFGSDYKLTSKSFPADIIDKIQIVDDKTREALFNNITTGNEDKAINLTLKKERNKGLFGRTTAGYGTLERYEGGASINALQGPLMVNLVGFANNTNKMGFSGNDFTASKSSGNLTGEGSGLTDAKGIGLNMGYEFSKKLQLTGSYFYNTNRETSNTSIRRQNILPDTSFFYYSDSRRTYKEDGHRANLELGYKLDSVTDLFVNGVFNAGSSDAMNYNDAKATSTSGELLNTAVNDLTDRVGNSDGSIGVFIGRRLTKPGRTLSFNLNYSGSRSRALDGNRGEIGFYQLNGSRITDTVDQQGNTRGSNRYWKISTAWAEPITPSINMLFRYSYTTGNGQSDKLTHRFNPLTGQYDMVDTSFSNLFTSRQQTHAPELSVNYTANKFNVLIGAGMQWLEQQNRSNQVKGALPQQYTNFSPRANVRYQFSRTGNINLTYNGRSEQPAIYLLQPVPDNSNPLYIRLGNPGLKPSFFHNININLQQYTTRGYWNAGVDIGSVRNQVVYDTWFDSVQISQPVNANGNYRISYNVNYSRNWRKKNWSLRISLGNNGEYVKVVAITNKISSFVNNYNVAQRIGFSFSFKKLFVVTTTYMIRYNDTRYTTEQIHPTENITQSLIMNLTLTWPKRFILENNLQYFSNSHTAPGFPRGVTMWHMALNYQLFSNKQATLRIGIYDLLRQTTSISRSITSIYIEDTQVQALQQYGLLSFIYNLKQFGK